MVRLIFLRFVVWYKNNLAAKVEKLRLVQALKCMAWYQTYLAWTR